MKKSLPIIIIFFGGIFSVMVIAAIINEKSKGDTTYPTCTTTSDSTDAHSTDFYDEPSTTDDEHTWLGRASMIAQEIVRDNFAADADFETLDYRGEKTMVPKRYKVLQKFTAELYGRKQTFVYKIFIQYYGGDWESRSNWDYGNLIIENCGTGQQWWFKGGMKERE